MIILCLNHKIEACGVYQYGLRIFNILKKSLLNNYIYKEIENYNEYINIINLIQPHVIIYNYHGSTMNWLNEHNIQKKFKNIGIPHETKPIFFDYILTIDPDENETHNSYNIPRPIYENVNELYTTYKIKNNTIQQFIEYNEGSDVPIFGSFGFGFKNKGFDKIIHIINEQYDRAIIKLIITYAHFDPNRDDNINTVSKLCNSINKKPGIKLMITHTFFTNEEILLFLQANSCNIFLYDTQPDRGQIVGISSVIDYAISVNKPFIISDSIMFRNIYSDDICVYKTDIKTAIENSRQKLPDLLRKYSNKKLINKVDAITYTFKKNKLKGMFYNSKKASCSIYESGLMVYNCLKQSLFYSLDYTEDQNFVYEYDFAVVNEHFTVNNWVTKQMVKQFNKPVFCIVTEVSFTEKYIDKSPNFYTAYMVLDSSITEKNNIYGFSRPLEDYIIPNHCENKIPVIGSFGFATSGKNWHKIVEETQKYFDEAIIRFNIPYATHIPNNKEQIDKVIVSCKNVITNPNINLEITHHNFSKEELINWCANNTINCFLYDREHLFTSGLCATADQAIISEKPLLVSKDCTFRHIHKYIDFYPNISIKQAIQNTIKGVKKMKQDWSSKNFLEKFESIFLLYKKETQNTYSCYDHIIFDYKVTAYYYTQNYTEIANVTDKLIILFNNYKNTNTDTFIVSNNIFSDTFFNKVKTLFINIEIDDKIFEINFKENEKVSWNNISNKINTYLDSQNTNYLIETSIGEIIDKYSILELKCKYISNTYKLKDIKHEMNVLEKYVSDIKETHFYKMLLYINEQIWIDTDIIKELNVNNINKDSETICRIYDQIFQNNQKRFRLKNHFNTIKKSHIKEHKSYTADGCFIEILDENDIYSKIPEINYLCISYDIIYFNNDYKNIIKKMFINTNIKFIENNNINSELKVKVEQDQNLSFKKFNLRTFTINTDIKDIFDFKPIKYKSGGRLGDFLNQLSVICEKFYETGRKGELYIFDLDDPGAKFIFGLENTHKDTYATIISQKFIKSYNIYNNENIDLDLSSWRNNILNHIKQNNNWSKIYNKEYSVLWGKNKWISSPIDPSWNNKIIINITHYRFMSSNAIYHLKENIKNFMSDCIFVSNEKEHYYYFIEETGIIINYYKPKDFTETVIILNSCKLAFLGFSSFGVIANALHKPIYIIGIQNNDFILNNIKSENILDIFV